MLARCNLFSLLPSTTTQSDSHRIGSALFSPAATLSLAATTICSLSMALFAVNYITCITTPLKPRIFHYLRASSFFRSSPPGSASPKLAASRPPPHTPFNSLRSLPYLKPSLSAGFRDIHNIYRKKTATKESKTRPKKKTSQTRRRVARKHFSSRRKSECELSVKCSV